MPHHYEAERCHTGGYLCGHHHRTPEAASRCLPGLSKRTGAGCFSMAQVREVTCREADRCVCTLREDLLAEEDCG